MSAHRQPLPTSSELTEIWRDLNSRYFDGALPPITLVWSRRLTASVGMFVSRTGPRSSWSEGAIPKAGKREIRLSLPLLTALLASTPFGENELVSTLAHEMIHQWQYDILKRRPNHGPDFLRKMREMNRDGTLAVTVYHALRKEVQALSRFAWRCGRCGRIYRRQRRTIQPRRHHCGSCRGTLHELSPSDLHRQSTNSADHPRPSRASHHLAGQLELDFSESAF
jgi:predicted SprT family Zn-dependent metalloprotease